MTYCQTLIEAHDLQALLSSAPVGAENQPADLVLLDCRAALGDPAAGPAAWARGHIPGAVHANLESELAAPAHSGPNKTGGRHPLPDRLQLASQCGEWGISTDTQVVAYDDAGGAYAARAWWLLRWLGHANVAVLNGGLAAWTETANGELVRGARQHQTSANFEVRKPLTRLASLDDVKAVVAGRQTEEFEAAPNPAPTLIDARAQQRFDGKMEPIDPVAGHIPQARCLPHSGNLGTDGRFLPSNQLAQRFHAIGNTEDLICYCGSGVTAAHNVLAIREAGLPEPRLYVGSWSEWTADPQRPIA